MTPTASMEGREAAATLPLLSPAAGRYRNLVVASGAAVLAFSTIYWESPDLLKYLTFLVVAGAISGARTVSHSGAVSLSPSLIVVLFGVAELTMPETVFLAALSALAPAVWRHMRGELQPHLAFDVAMAAVGAGFAARVFS